MAHINGIYQFDNKMMNADVNFVFSDFQTNYPDFGTFQPPPDIWCQVLKFFTTSKSDRRLSRQKICQRISVMETNAGVFGVFKTKKELKCQSVFITEILDGKF